MKRVTQRLSVMFGVMALAGGYLYGISSEHSRSLVRQIPQINTKVRIHHAKELFGKQYNLSVVRRAEFAGGIEDFIVERVEKGLPKNWRRHSFAIAESIINEGNRYHLDPLFLLAVITRESRLNPEAKGLHGEIGLMQLKPDTAEWIARKSNKAWANSSTLLDPLQNIRLGAAYLNLLRKRYERHSLYYLSAYNMGPRRLHQLVSQDIQPKEYAANVMVIYTSMYKDLVRQNLARVANSSQIRLATR